ncbi:MAG: archaellin/type IV pilin N-terminal domain-containing protein [Candidatus Thermoplasmatota archaeon]
MKIREKEAISPVIGVILMVVITVILAAVVYLWVAGFFGVGKLTPVCSPVTEGTGVAGYTYAIRIADASPPAGVKAVRYFLQDSGGIQIVYDGNAISGNVSDIYSKDVNGIKFQDNDMDGKISAGDVFLLKSPPAQGGHRLLLKYIPSDGQVMIATIW